MEDSEEVQKGPGKKRGPLWRGSIGSKLTIAFLALAIIPMSATAYYNLTQGRSELAEATRENLIELSASTANQIEQLLTENQRTSATLAGEPLAAEFLAASEEERQALSPRVYRMLQNFADTHPDYDAPGLLDVNGIVVASLEELLMGKDRSFRDYFQASIQGESYVSSMLVGRATGRPGVFLTNPVVTEGGDIVGIDIVWLKGDAIWSIIDDVSVGEEGIAYLVDQDAVIIAHPNRDLLYHSLGELTPEAVETITQTIRFGVIEGTDTPLVPESLEMEDLAAALGRAVGADTCGYSSPLDQSDHVAGYAPLEAYPWTVVVDLPEAQFLAPMERLSGIIWVNVGLVALIMLGISVLLVRVIIRRIVPLPGVGAAVEREGVFESGDLRVREKVGRSEVVIAGAVFGLAIVLVAADEIFDLPRLILGAPPTPINWGEIAIETLFLVVCASVMLSVMSRLASGRRCAEARAAHVNLVLRAVRNVNQLIAREKDRDGLLRGACANLTETRGYDGGWIALLDESGRLLAHAEAGLGDDFLPMVERLERGELPGCGRKALAQGEVVVTEVGSPTCADCPLSGKYSGRGALTGGLEYGGKVFGLLSAHISSGLVADQEEINLFREVSQDIAFALHNLEQEEKRRRAEERLRESEGNFRALADSASEGISVVTSDGIHAYVNRRAAEIVGYSVEELQHMSMRDLMPPDVAKKMSGVLERRLAGEPAPATHEIAIVRKDGERVPVEISGARTIWRGQPADLVLSRDISERKRAEAELEKHREHLEELVEERTAELRDAQEELVRKEKLAILGQLAGGVSHELRNPLGVISNAVYFLQMTHSEADETTREYLEMIGFEVRKAEKIVSDLLDFSRSRLAERQEVAVSDLVEQVLETQPPPEGVEVDTEIASGLPPVFVDPAQMGQVLNNLISNACQAMPEGGKLSIRAQAAEGGPVGSPQSAVRIQVSDTGCGISKENLGKIFEPLFTTRARGIGLGLAVSRSLVEANGGNIEVKSEEGKGSTFTVILPAGEVGK